ncbi:unnamed protein product [Rhizophagus irregularis]|nr:unnamed protein product [Rhizophagus irregularis]
MSRKCLGGFRPSVQKVSGILQFSGRFPSTRTFSGCFSYNFRTFLFYRVHLRQALTLFVKQQRNLSLGPVKSDKIQGRHEWALDKLKEEVIRPSVEPEEIIKVIDEFQNDQQEENDDVLSKISVDDVLDAEVWTNRLIVNFLKKLRESLLTEDDVIEYINECKLTTQLVEEVEKKLIPAFITHSNKIPTKEEIEEFDTNN